MKTSHLPVVLLALVIASGCDTFNRVSRTAKLTEMPDPSKVEEECDPVRTCEPR